MLPRFHCRSLVFAVLTLALTNGWTQQYWSQTPGSPGGTTRHDDVFFVDATNGWATRSGLIYATTNSGGTWEQKLSKSGTHFRSIGFASASRGWAGNLGPGSYDSSITDTNVLYETFDGGQNWSVVPGLNETGMRGFCSLHVLDSQHIYGGGRVRGPAYFCKTENGGTNWTVVNLTASGVMNGIMDVYFKDTTNGFVVGMDTNSYSSCPADYRGRIARTTDGGNTWTPVVTTTLTCCYFWKMSWPTPDVGYVSLQRNPTSSDFIVFYKTTNGGSTWVSNGIPVSSFGNTQFYWQGIGFVNATEGWAGGEGGASQFTNTFLHTVDGGTTWAPSGYSNSRSINRIRFLSPILGFASGQKLHIYRVPLVITHHPQKITAHPGGTVSFSVQATGDPNITFRWAKDGSTITGATNATLLLTNISRTHAGFYSVAVTNSGATLISSNAELHVLSPPRFENISSDSGTLRLTLADSTGPVLTSNDLPHLFVETSSNLVEWLPFTNGLSLTNGRVRFEDPATQPRQFYRVSDR